METKTVIVTMISPITIIREPSLRSLEEVLRERLREILAREKSAVLGNSTVEDVHILKPGQGYVYNPSGPTGKTEEIVDEPAAAGEEEEEIGNLYTYLEGDQFLRAEMVIRAVLAPVGVGVWDAKLSRTTDTIIATVRFVDGCEQIVTVPLPPTVIANILLG